MNARVRPMVLAAALGACLALAQAPAWTASATQKWGGKTYKWVDEHGVTHYGDSIPPEYAHQGRSELNSQGVEIRQVPRQLSGAEADKAQKAATEAARLRQHDSFLMTTYTSAKDIEQLRDERLALIANQMEIARGSVSSTVLRLTTLETRMRTFKPWSAAVSGRRLPDQLVEEVVRTLQERNSLQAALASREKERNDLRAQFNTDLRRYRELTEAPRSAPLEPLRP